MTERQLIDISSSTLFRFIFMILILVFLYLVRDVIFILLFSIIVAAAISPFADWLSKKGFPRLLGVLLLYLLVFGLAILFLSLTIPFVAQEVSQLAESLPQYLAKISASLKNVKEASPQYLNILGDFQGILDNLSQFLQDSSQSVISLIVGIFGGLFAFAAVIVISFYLSVMRNGIEGFLRSVIPNEYESYVLDLWRRSEAKLGRWVQGQILLALIVGLAVYLGLELLGVKFALLLGVVAMVLELVPNVGPVLAAIPAVIVAFVQGPPMLGVYVIALYLIIQALENNVLVPLIIGGRLGLNPVIVIIALLVGGKLAGVPGLLISVPIATVIAEFFNDLVEKKEKRKTIAEATATSI